MYSNQLHHLRTEVRGILWLILTEPNIEYYSNITYNYVARESSRDSLHSSASVAEHADSYALYLSTNLTAVIGTGLGDEAYSV